MKSRQHLTALGLGRQSLSDVASPGSEVDRRAEQLRGLVTSLSQETHALAMRLRPKALDDFGLQAALEAYVDAWSHRRESPWTCTRRRGPSDCRPSGSPLASARIASMQPRTGSAKNSAPL